MATHIITVDDSTQAGARLLELAKDMAKLYKESVTIKPKKKKISSAAKSINQGLKDLKAMKEGKLKGYNFDELMEELSND